jgi:maltose alpha-D-glucosyltransferase/alpha-amylase
MYYGDELGMKFEENLSSVEGGYKRTGTRAPMQWDKSKNAGFSNAKKLYIPVNPDRKGLSVAEEEQDPDSLLEFVKTLINFKRTHLALDNDANFELVKTTGYSPLVYIRKKYTEELLIAINPSNKKYSVSFTPDFKGHSLFSIGEATIDSEKAKIKLSPRSLIIIE